MKMPNFQNLLFVVIFVLNGCQLFGEGYERYGLNPKFRYDIPALPRDYRFDFDPKNLPEEGKTTLQELDRMYPVGPSGKWSFYPERIIILKGGKYAVDKIITYEEINREAVEGPGYSGSTLKEIITLTCFVKGNVVIKISIQHIVGKPQFWKPGMYHTGENDWTNGNDGWFSIVKDKIFYWEHRGDEKKFDKYQQSGLYYKEVWRKASERYIPRK